MGMTSEAFSEKDLIARVLVEASGEIRKAAQKLGISETWTQRKIAEHGLEGLVKR